MTNILTHGDIDPGLCLRHRAACSRPSSAPFRRTTSLHLGMRLPLRTRHPPMSSLCTSQKLRKPPHVAARTLTVPSRLGQGFLHLPGPPTLVPGWRELPPSLLPWSLLLLLRTFSHLATPPFLAPELQSSPPARMSHSRVAFEASPSRHHLRPTSSSLETASYASARPTLVQCTLRITLKTWLTVIRLLFWVPLTPEEASWSKASWLVPQAALLSCTTVKRQINLS